MKRRLAYISASVVSVALALVLQLSFAPAKVKAKQDSQCDACLATAEQQFEQCMQTANAQNRGGSKRESRLAAHRECQTTYREAKDNCRSTFTDCTTDDDNDDEIPATTSAR